METHTLKKIETAAIGTVLGAVPVIACFLTGWWLSLPFLPESGIILCALAGLLAGIIVDVIFLKRWVQRADSMKLGIWMAVHVFYSVCVLGFFMGVPVFNVVLALPAGVFVGRFLARGGADPACVKKAARRTALFTVGIMVLVCMASATAALASPSTPWELQHMLGLKFEVTILMVIGLIVWGGALLLAIDWWLTVKSVKLAHRFYAVRTAPAIT